MSRLLTFALTALAVAALATVAACAPAPKSESSGNDWPQFRGLNRDNVSPDKGLLKAWEGAPKLLWTGKGVGEGFSSIAVVGDKVFTMGDKAGSSWIFALGRDKGELLWSAKVGKPGGNYKGTRCTPTVDGEMVYGLGQFGDLVCVQSSDGKEVWRKNFKKDFEGNSGGWNYTESPLIDGDRLVCTPGGKTASMVALNKKTGEEVWRSPLGDTAGYSSIVVSKAAGVKQYVQLTANGTIGVAAKDGKLLWRYTKLANNTANVPTPVVLGDQIFTCAGYGKGGALLTLASNGEDGVKQTEEYYKNDLKNKHGGVVVVGKYVYGDTDDSSNVHCADWKTGKVKWTRRKAAKQGQGGGSASVTYADGNLYIHYQNGWVSLVPTGTDSYTEKGSFKAPGSDRAGCWAHPVVIGGRLYIREKDNLFCYDVKAQ